MSLGANCNIVFRGLKSALPTNMETEFLITFICSSCLSVLADTILVIASAIILRLCCCCSCGLQKNKLSKPMCRKTPFVDGVPERLHEFHSTALRNRVHRNLRGRGQTHEILLRLQRRVFLDHQLVTSLLRVQAVGMEDSASPEVSVQQRGLEDGLAWAPSSPREADKAS